MQHVERNLVPEDKARNTQKRNKRRRRKQWLDTFTKRALTAILVFSLLDLQLTYVLAFMGKEQIAESLSSDIATTIVAAMLGYFLKSLFETFFEKREERLRGEFNEEEV